MSFTVGRYTDVMSWTMTHKVRIYGRNFESCTRSKTSSQGDGVGADTWSHHSDVSKVLEITSKIPGFPEIANRLIKKSPKDGIIDWELMWRDPRENWVSPLGRVVQVGDSAHTFLPSSGNGATQAMEDAISLATCLQIGGKSSINWATKIHNKLR
jgi:2-polyprenyl-6-methoxyphenol hydroxylase-like FAD-dependent oxidoreductase